MALKIEQPLGMPAAQVAQAYLPSMETHQEQIPRADEANRFPDIVFPSRNLPFFWGTLGSERRHVKNEDGQIRA